MFCQVVKREENPVLYQSFFMGVKNNILRKTYNHDNEMPLYLAVLIVHEGVWQSQVRCLLCFYSLGKGHIGPWFSSIVL